jgi:hypothetical protein
MKNNNVIQFPVKNKREDVFSEDEVEARKRVALYRIRFIDDIVHTRFSQILSDLRNAGYPTLDREFLLNTVFASEILKSVFYDSANIYHPLFEETENLREKYKNELTSLKNADNIQDTDNSDGENEDE